MGDSTVADEPAQLRSLSNAKAAQWNKDLLLTFQEALENNPAADLMSIIPDLYRRDHRRTQYRELSYAAKLNLRTVHELRDELRDAPEVDLRSVFPQDYARRIEMSTSASSSARSAEKEAEDTRKRKRGTPEFRERLDLAETATVIFPLSEKAAALLPQYSIPSPDGLNNSEKLLATLLKGLIRGSPQIWENPVRGVVVKCDNGIIIKVITDRSEDYTEYTSMQYIAERVPDIPAPRSHGMVQLGPFRATFISYVPGMTLSEVWPTLSHDEKILIQHQLDTIFRRLGTLRQDDGEPLGGVGGEGVKDYRVSGRPHPKVITTAADFSNLQFCAPHHGSKSYVKFIRSLLGDEEVRGSVFTHGDIRRSNIMVDRDLSHNNNWVVSGIIDWEDSGFYPEYYECTTLTGNLSLVEEDDWFHYLPNSISPSRFPVRWLVDKLWDIHLKTS